MILRNLVLQMRDLAQVDNADWTTQHDIEFAKVEGELLVEVDRIDALLRRVGRAVNSLKDELKC
jgi:hypothetical protein